MHTLLAEVDQFAVGPVAGVLAGQHGDGRRHDRQADVRQVGARSWHQAAQRLRCLDAAFPHVQMRVGAIADVGVHQLDVGRRHIGVQIVGRDDRHLIADHAADHGQQRALGIVVVHGQSSAVQHAVNAVEFAGCAQVGLPLRHHAVEEFLRHRPVRLGHRQQTGFRLPGAGRVHVGDEAGHLPQHHRRGRPCIGQHGVAAEQGPRAKVGFEGDRREAIAFDGKPQQGNARAGHAAIPICSAIRPWLSTRCRSSPARWFHPAGSSPAASNCPKPATTWADVGST